MGDMDRVMAEPEATAALVERARRGDRVAFEALTSQVRSRLLDRIQGMVGQKLREKVDPEDVLQETFLRGLGSIERFEGRDEDAFLRWLDGIARNVVRNLGRKRLWKKELELTRDVPAGDSSPSRRERREERFERLSRSVESLSPDHQTVIRLARIEGLKLKEVARRMNRSESAVKNLLLRAMRDLRDSFGRTDSFSLPDRPLGDEGGSDGG
jgi:RNA polymerase sigma factor (sigma-70 family)